jgi:hypothetical protein
MKHTFILYVFISSAMQKCIHIFPTIFHFLRIPVNYLAFQSFDFDDYPVILSIQENKQRFNIKNNMLYYYVRIVRD